jgi:signal transduction histidine kinase
MVDDLLESARIQSSHLLLRRQPMDLVPLARDAMANQVAVAKERGVTMSVEATGPAIVDADATRIAQVLDNFLNNALKFTKRGGTIRVAVSAKGRIEVVDDGIGLTEAAAAKLFQPFSQVHDAATLNVGGTGLGLYICKGIIDAHGGAIGAQSAGPGKGSRFWFELPLARVGQTPGEPTARTSVSPQTSRVLGKNDDS